MLMLFLVQSVTASAETKLYMESFSIANGETREVALILENDKEATALQATIELPLPAGLQIVEGSVAKTSRVKGRGAEVKTSVNTGNLVIVETDGTIAAGEGAVITFLVERDGGIDDGEYFINISNIIVSDANGDQLNTEETQEAQVNFVGLRDCTFAAPEDIDVTVGQEYQVDVTLTNEDVDNLSAFQGKLALPAGLEIVEGEDGKFIYSDRIPAKAEFKFQEYDGYTQFVLSSTSNQTITGYEGVIFSFKVKATEALAENAEIKLTDLRVAATTGQSVQSPDVTISVTNTSVADKAAFDQYKVDEAAAIEAMAEEGDSEASQALIADAKAAVEELTFDYALSLDENKALIDEIVTNLADALEAQRQQEAEEAAAVEAANAKVAELKEAAEALAVSEEAKAYEAENVQAAVATAEDAIAAVAPTIEAVEAVITEGKIATENKEALEAAFAAVDEAIEGAENAIEVAQETYETQKEMDDTEAAAVEEANAKVADLKEAAEALAVSEEAKAYEAENVQAAVADAEAAIAAVAPTIEAVEAVIAEGKIATENKEALEAAFAAVDEAIEGAEDAIQEAQETYETQKGLDDAEAAAVKQANEDLATVKEEAEGLAVSEEAKAYPAENVQAAVATAEEAIAAVAPTIEAVEAIIAEGKLSTENKEALEAAFETATVAITAAINAIDDAQETYKNQKQIDDAAEAGAKASAEASLLNLQIAMEDAVVSDEAKEYPAENVQEAVAEAEAAIATAEAAIADVEAIIAEGKLATENKVAIAQAINAAQKAVNAAVAEAAFAEQTYIAQKEADENIRGDVNGDRVVNGTDIQAVINFIVAGQYDEKADVNKDGVVNGTDIQEIINIIVGNE